MRKFVSFYITTNILSKWFGQSNFHDNHILHHNLKLIMGILKRNSDHNSLKTFLLSIWMAKVFCDQSKQAVVFLSDH